jgi:hypothetical protein
MTSPQSSEPSNSTSPLRRTFLGFLAWGAVMAVGFGALVSYQMKAGTAASAPEAWPAEASLKLDPARRNLVMFAHPKCPCSTASLEELKDILTRSRGRITATICFFDPEGMPSTWRLASLVREAAAIPGVKVVADRNGVLAGKFGAMTSGQILVFDGQGRREFVGGITPARGHVGDNRGRATVLALAKGEVCAAAPTLVFGCALHERADLVVASR